MVATFNPNQSTYERKEGWAVATSAASSNKARMTRTGQMISRIGAITYDDEFSLAVLVQNVTLTFESKRRNDGNGLC